DPRGKNNRRNCISIPCEPQDSGQLSLQHQIKTWRVLRHRASIFRLAAWSHYTHCTIVLDLENSISQLRKETSQFRDQNALDAPILSQSTNRERRGSGLRAPDKSHCKRRIASIIVTAQVTQKIATNTRSPCTAARTQPSAASAESMTSSRIRGSICRMLFISHLFWRRPDPPMRVNATGRGLPQRIPPLPERHGLRRP